MIRTARPWRWAVAAVALCAAASLPSPAAAQPLPVPFLPQTEALCGGAAAAMVMRYWGAADAYPDAFAPLVDRAAGGIRTDALTADLERRGWVAVAGPGNMAELGKELGRRRPVITLLLDRPGRYHYVVVVAQSGGQITVHDPARGPDRVLDATRFAKAWEQSGQWMLLLLPSPALGGVSAGVAPAGGAAAPETPTNESVLLENGRASACAVLVDGGIARASDDRSAARALLTRATTACPGEAAGWRELAGLDTLDSDWAAAAAHAERATAIDPHDDLAWRTLATARYLLHDDLAALAAWNRVDEPRVSLIEIKGLAHTRYDVIADAIGVQLKSILTSDAIRRADRRVRDVPAVAGGRVTFHPVENHTVQIDAAVVERDRGPFGRMAWVRAGVDALTGREVSAVFSNPTGGGDAAGITWRWWEHRPMVSAFYAAPAPTALGGGVWRLDVSRETQTFAAQPVPETRTRAGFTLGRWVADGTRLTGGVSIERWTDRARDVALGVGLEQWMAANRVRLQVDATQAFSRDAFTTAGATAAVRTAAANDGFVAFGVAGYRLATGGSPASVWPGADTGQARDILLRAHPLLEDGIVTGGAFGRQLAFGTIEAQRWTLLRRLPVRIAPAVFADVARATKGLDAADTRVHVDAGGGVRIALPAAGVVRIDLAHGLRDGGWVLSAGWDRRWR